MRKLRTFLALDGADRLASIEAMTLILVAKLLVVRVPPRRWRARLDTDHQPDDTYHDVATVRRVRLAIQRALANVPGAPNCLPQALAARWMLERRGIASRLYIGTAPDEAGTPRFHAWLKVGDEWVTGLCDEASYILFQTESASTV